MVNRVSWKQVGSVKEPGRYMLRFGWVTIRAEDLAIWEKYPDAIFTLYEVARTESNEEYRLGSVDLTIPAGAAP
jgi:hypothetical protein